MKRHYLKIGFLFFATFMVGFSNVNSAISAQPLPESEIQALYDWQNWVGDGCSSGDNNAGADVAATVPTTSSCACSAGVSSPVATSGSTDNTQAAWTFFKYKKGLSDAQTAGVVGNLQDESSLKIDPELNQSNQTDTLTQPTSGGKDGWGIAQWTYPFQDVNSLVNKYNISGPIYSLDTQLQLVWAQMKDISPKGVSDMLSQLKNINDASQAATYFQLNFEGGEAGNRVLYATNLYSNASSLNANTYTASDSGPAATVTSDVLDGHKLPATIGGVGLESFFPSYALGTPANQNDDNFYINMRWRYQLWNWDGTSVAGPENVNFYLNHPLVLVTNPRNHKSIIADALEAGPAPWTGVDKGRNDIPKEGWTNPQDGTPPAYTGRVSGFPPPAFQALGAIQDVFGQGDKLLYAWAPDQNATPGPTNLQVTASGIDGSSNCGNSGTTSSGTYQNPFHDMSAVINSRIDEGADYSTSSSVPVYAIGDGVVTASYKGTSNWYPQEPNWLVYRLTDGPAVGKDVYVAEDCPPLVNVGDIVSPTSGPLCNMGPASIETGWAFNDTAQEAAAGPVYKEGFETAYGVNFNQLMVSLGVPTDYLDKSHDPSGAVLGTLPSGWPTWQ